MLAIVYTDGSYRKDGTKHEAKTGWVVTVMTEPPLTVSFGGGVKTTIKGSEEVEWRAVFDAFAWLARIKDIDTVAVRTDLKSLSGAINGTGGSTKGVAYAKCLRQTYPNVTIYAGWVPREHNKMADRLSKIGHTNQRSQP